MCKIRIVLHIYCKNNCNDKKVNISYSYKNAFNNATHNIERQNLIRNSKVYVD